ncbi:hypothetical protein CYMTET_5667, partial [Cymbomonas tetramitiformis]
MRSNELKASLTTEGVPFGTVCRSAAPESNCILPASIGPGCSMKTTVRVSSMPSRCRRKNELSKRYELSATEDKPKVSMKWKSKAIWGIVSVISVQIFIYGSYRVHNKGFAPQLSSLPSPTAVAVYEGVSSQIHYGCDSGWAHSEGRCFKYFAAARSFLEAEAACQTAHAMAHLSSIESWEDSSMQDKLPYICSYLLEVVPAMLSPVTLPPTKDLASTMVPTATGSAPPPRHLTPTQKSPGHCVADAVCGSCRVHGRMLCRHVRAQQHRPQALPA